MVNDNLDIPGRSGLSTASLHFHRFLKAFDDGELEQFEQTEMCRNNKMTKRPSVLVNFIDQE